jgi:hypothetical protein
MKSKAIIFIFAVLISQAYSSQEQPAKKNFRDASWGMTMESVLQLESKQPDSKGKNRIGMDLIAYAGQAGNLDCLYVYFFAENKLVQGRYMFTGEHVNENAYIEDFNTVKKSLTDKYGKPKEDRMVWRNNLYKDDPDHWGMAVSAGHLIYEANWVTEDTDILLHLTGDNFKITHLLQYTSTIKEHADLIKKAEEKAKSGIW